MSNFTNSLQTCTRNNTSKQHVKLSNMYDEFLKHIFLKILVSCLMYIYTPCVWPGAYGDQKRVSNPLELELRVAVNLHVSAEN